MNKEFLKNFKVGNATLPDEVINAIMQENQRDIDAAKANPGGNGGNGGKMFTQDEVNRIVSDRLAREREKPGDEREQALKAREARLDCRDYLDSKKYPVALMDILDSSDVEKFKAAADALAAKFPGVMDNSPAPPPYASGTGTTRLSGNNEDPLSAAFKPPVI